MSQQNTIHATEYALLRTPTRLNISFHLSYTVCTPCMCVSLSGSIPRSLSLSLPLSASLLMNIEKYYTNILHLN